MRTRIELIFAEPYRICIFLLMLGSTNLSAQWTELGSGDHGLNTSTEALRITVDTFGNVYAGGSFLDLNHKRFVTKWDGVSWTATGVDATALNANDDIISLATDLAGNVYAGGQFTNESGKNYVAKWDGNSWTELGAGANDGIVNGYINAIITDSAGNVYVGGTNEITTENPFFYVSKWNGTAWAKLEGTNTLNYTNSITGLAIDHSGNIYVAGYGRDSNDKYYIAKWDGASWSELGHLNPASGATYAVTTGSNGNVYTAGTITNGNGKKYIAQWDGNSWTQLGDPAVTDAVQIIRCLATDAVGNLYAAAGPSSTNNEAYVSQWNGITWSVIGTFTNPLLPSNVFISTLCVDKNDNLYAAGFFTNPEKDFYVAFYQSTVGINTFNEKLTHIKIFPNPASNNINIHFDSQSSRALIEIYSILGKNIFTRSSTSTLGSFNEQIDLSRFPAGTYIISVKTETGISISRIIKE